MIYDFDTTATSPVLPEVLEAYAENLKEPANNPSSAHGGGLSASASLEEARAGIARLLDCGADEIFFTSGGTESINWALKGAAWAGRRLPKRALFTAGEHEAVRASLLFLQDDQDYVIEELPVLESGSLDPQALESALAQPAGLISTLAVSNETGAINDLYLLRPLIRRLAPQAVWHSDIVQLCGKLPFSFKKSGLDLASVSGHKLGAPRGTGLLIKRKALKVTPLFHGGGQEIGLRSGTSDVPGALALAAAIAFHYRNMDDEIQKTRRIRDLFLKALDEEGMTYTVLSPHEGSPFVLSIAFPGIRGETLLHALSAESIYISTGSACGSKKGGENRVLSAMGFDKMLVYSAVRISFNGGQADADVRHLAARITDLHRRYAV